MKKNVFLTFITACIPGFGQMYYGLMRRGFSVGFWFYITFALTVYWHLPILGVLLPLLWAYSFFDTFNLRALSKEQYDQFPDAFLPDIAFLQSLGTKKPLKQRGRKYWGLALILIGLLFLYNALIVNNPIFYSLLQIPLFNFIFRALPGAFIGILVILVGAFMLRGRKPTFVDKLEDSFFSDAPLQKDTPEKEELPGLPPIPEAMELPAPIAEPTFDGEADTSLDTSPDTILTGDIADADGTASPEPPAPKEPVEPATSNDSVPSSLDHENHTSAQ